MKLSVQNAERSFEKIKNFREGDFMKWKNFFLMFPRIIFLLFLSACSTTSYAVHSDDYANFYLQLTTDKQSLIKGITLAEADPSFWSQSKDISFNLYPAQVTAWGVGGINTGETAVEDAKATAPLLIAQGVTQGINPATGVSAGLGILLLGPQRAQDPLLQEKVNQLLDSYDWEMNDYFFQLLKKSTTLSFNKQETSDFIFDRFGKPTKTEQTLEKTNIIVFFNFILSPSRMGGWTEPKYILEANAGITVTTKEALEAFKAHFPHRTPIFSETNAIEGGSGSTLRRVPAYPGMYMASIYKNSKYHTREEWLSHNGALLQEQLKEAIEYLAQEADRLVFAGKQENIK